MAHGGLLSICVCDENALDIYPDPITLRDKHRTPNDLAPKIVPSQTAISLNLIKKHENTFGMTQLHFAVTT